MAIDIAGQKLLERFAAGGFTELISDEPMRLSEFLRARAKEDGMEPRPFWRMSFVVFTFSSWITMNGEAQAPIS